MGIRLYGDVEVVIGEDHRPVRGARERAILALLATRPGSFVAGDVLLDQFWPDANFAGAVRSLRVRISNLRLMLTASGAEIKTLAGGYVLESGAGVIDLDRVRDNITGSVRSLTGMCSRWRSMPAS